MDELAAMEVIGVIVDPITSNVMTDLDKIPILRGIVFVWFTRIDAS